MPEPLTTAHATASRADGRTPDQLRPIRFQNGIAPHAAGSTLITCGRTQVICAVTIDETVPRWMKEQNVPGGWLTAEYSLLPYSTLQRKPREIARGKIDGRTQEIQRLIGRSLRAAVNLQKTGPRTFWIDCDVLQADGGTRTASITGAYVALYLALQKLIDAGKLAENPLLQAVAGISVGIVEHRPLLDLDYSEDAAAEVDMNLALTASGEFIELQGTGEEATFSPAQLEAMIALGRQGATELFRLQRLALAAGPTATASTALA